MVNCKLGRVWFYYALIVIYKAFRKLEKEAMKKVQISVCEGV